ncbi:MAG: nucleotide exchange factor GrpE [Candidatus Ventricola sp.]
MKQKKKRKTGAAKATIRERVKQAADSLKERQKTMNEETQVQQEGMAPDQPQTPEQAEKAVLDGEEIQESAQAETAALEKELEETRAQRDEYLDLVQRKQAEFANYRRRTESVRQEAYDDGRRDAIEKLLPVVDNLERALDAAGEESALRSGVEMVLRQTLETLTKMGVETIDPMGQPFDAELHNAVMQGSAEEGEPGTVCQVLQKGYRLGGRVIRHAMVKVVAG